MHSRVDRRKTSGFGREVILWYCDLQSQDEQLPNKSCVHRDDTCPRQGSVTLLTFVSCVTESDLLFKKLPTL